MDILNGSCQSDAIRARRLICHGEQDPIDLILLFTFLIEGEK